MLFRSVGAGCTCVEGQLVERFLVLVQMDRELLQQASPLVKVEHPESRPALVARMAQGCAHVDAARVDQRERRACHSAGHFGGCAGAGMPATFDKALIRESNIFHELPSQLISNNIVEKAATEPVVKKTTIYGLLASLEIGRAHV